MNAPTVNDHPPLHFGTVLRQRREELGLTLNDMAVRTRVHKNYLQALEEENLRLLPGTAYAVGFLRIYARDLGLPVAPLIAALQKGEPLATDASHPATGDRYLRTARHSRRPPGGRQLFLGLLLLGLAAAGVIYWQVRRPAPSPVPDAPAVSEQPLPPAETSKPAAAAPSTSGAAAPGEMAAAIELPALPAGGAVVRMIPVDPGTLKVSLDGQEVREYQLQRDQALNWKVASSLSCELSASGLVRLWVGEDELAVADHQAFTLVKAAPVDSRP